MVKHGKDNNKLTNTEWNSLVRTFIQTVAKLATRNPGEATALSRATDLSLSAITQMKNTGKASPVSFIRVAAFLAGLTDQQTKNLLENPGSILKNLEPTSEIETLFNEVRAYYNDNELAAWLKLLKSKHLVESQLGITVSAQVQKPKNTKKSKIQS